MSGKSGLAANTQITHKTPHACESGLLKVTQFVCTLKNKYEKLQISFVVRPINIRGYFKTYLRFNHHGSILPR